MDLPQIRRTRAVIAPTLRNADGTFVTDAAEKTDTLTTPYAALWEDMEKIHRGEFQTGYMQYGIRRYSIFPFIEWIYDTRYGFKDGQGQDVR